jgi:uncharacterized protein (TIGR02145 family)
MKKIKRMKKKHELQVGKIANWAQKPIPFILQINCLILILSVLYLTSCNSKNENEVLVNTYNGGEVKIDSQIWMNQNLNVNTFKNGDPIPQAKTNEEWEQAGKKKQPVWCYYDNDPKNGAKYGKLYNWYAVNDKRGLAPNGWHVPTDAEWTILETFLGTEAGKKMKSTSGWKDFVTDNTCSNCASWNEEYRKKVPCHECKDNRVIGAKETISGNGTNSSGFSGLPGGYRNYYGNFFSIGIYGYWWSSAEFDTYYAYGRYLLLNDDSLGRFSVYKEEGLSVRCLRD